MADVGHQILSEPPAHGVPVFFVAENEGSGGFSVVEVADIPSGVAEESSMSPSSSDRYHRAFQLRCLAGEAEFEAQSDLTVRAGLRIITLKIDFVGSIGRTRCAQF